MDQNIESANQPNPIPQPENPVPSQQSTSTFLSKQQGNPENKSMKPTTNQSLSIIPLGGTGDVTRNMYLYEYKDQILIVDCGIGFADETMLGVDLLLPDISYLLKTQKKIVGMVLTHGHEDHIGALPFILPQLPNFPIFATPLTASLANEKLREYGVNRQIQSVPFESTKDIFRGDFQFSFIRVTHSIPDTAHIFIKTPVGNFYHGSDFKLDLTPVDGKRSDYHKIVRLASAGVRCHLSDCLGAEREGATPSELSLTGNFEREIRECKGKFIVTTFGSNISRLNQAIEVAEKYGRRVCFVGRSLIKAKDIADRLGYLKMNKNTEVDIKDLKNYRDSDMMLLVAGSQGQERSAMTRIANGEHLDVRLTADDVVVFSSDPIPGNEVNVNALIDTIARTGARAVYSNHTGTFHVSGHGYAHDLMLMMSLIKGKKLFPIGGNYKHMVAYKNLAKRVGYQDRDVFMPDDGQEIIFPKNGDPRFGRKIKINNVFVDQVSGEEVESFVLRDRQKLSTEGVVVLLIELESSTGMIADRPEIIARGFSPADVGVVQKQLAKAISDSMSKNKGKVTDVGYIRKSIMNIADKEIFRALKRRPLVLPVIIEV